MRNSDAHAPIALRVQEEDMVATVPLVAELEWRSIVRQVDRIVNLTPHVIDIVVDGAVVASIAPEGSVARVAETMRNDGSIAVGGVSVSLQLVESQHVMGLPDPRPGVLYVVSRIVAERLPDRADVVFPYTLVRNDDGVVIGCGSFGRIG